MIEGSEAGIIGDIDPGNRLAGSGISPGDGDLRTGVGSTDTTGIQRDYRGEWLDSGHLQLRSRRSYGLSIHTGFKIVFRGIKDPGQTI